MAVGMVDWHVKADGRWQVVSVAAGSAGPVNVWVSATRMSPVEYRYHADECMGWCRLECGHTLTDGCSCATDKAPVVVQTTDGYGECLVSVGLADAMVACFEADPGCVVRRVWDRVSYSVSVTYVGEGWPFASWVVGHDDVSWREI